MRHHLLWIQTSIKIEIDNMNIGNLAEKDTFEMSLCMHYITGLNESTQILRIKKDSYN